MLFLSKNRLWQSVILLLFINLGYSQNPESDLGHQSEKDYDAIRRVFQKRLDRYENERIKISSTFHDSLIQIQQWAQEKGTPEQQLMADFQSYFAYDQRLDYDKVIEVGTKLLENDDFLNYPQSSFTARGVLNAYFRKGFYRKQLELYPLFELLNARHGYNVRKKSYVNYHEVAMIYYNIGLYESAREDFFKQVDIFIEEDDFFRAASMYNNIALTYEKEYDYDNALSFYDEALEYFDRDNKSDPFFSDEYKRHFKNVINSNVASLQLKKQEPDEVLSLFLKELKSSKEVNEPRTVFQAYNNLTEFYLFDRKYDQALTYNDSAINISRSYSYPLLLADALELRSRYNLTQERTELALVNRLESRKLRDSINSMRNLNSFEEATLKFDLEATRGELDLSKKLLDEKQRVNVYQLIVLAIIATALLIFLIQYFRIKRKNKSILKKESQLSKALKANKTMLEEVHHRIKNNLQVISGLLELKSSNITPENSANVISETQRYIDSMSYIQQHLYSQDSKEVVDMQPYLEQLVKAVISNYRLITVNLSIEAKGITLSNDQATPLGLIVCELVTNSGKHAFTDKGSIKINMDKIPTGYRFYYQDNGCGFDIKNKVQTEGLGLGLIDMLVDELEATAVKSVNGGFHFTIEF